MKVLIENVNEDTRGDWLALKQKTIGSSEIATILGLNKFQSPYQLWMEKTEKTKLREVSDSMWLGSELEPVVAKLYSKKRGIEVKKAAYMAVMDDYEWASATPDYQHQDDGTIVECKTTNFRGAKDWENENVPDYAHCQLMWQLGVLGIDKGVVTCLPANSPDLFVYKEFEFEKQLFDLMFSKAEEFLDFVRKDIPPEVSGQDKKILEEQLKNTLNPNDSKIVVLEKNDENQQLFRSYNLLSMGISHLRKEIKTAEEKQDEIKSKILNILNNNAANQVEYVSEDGIYTMRIKSVERKSYVVNSTSYVSWDFKFLKNENGNI